MKKYVFYSVLILVFSVFLGNLSIANAANDHFVGTKIIKSSNSFVSGSNTKVTVLLDFSDDTAWNGVGQKYHLNVNENATGKEIVSTDVLLDANLILAATMTGLTPSTDYTLFLKPFNSTTNKNEDRKPPYTIGFRTYSNPTAFKSFKYDKTTPISGKQRISASVLYEWVPDDAYMRFSIANSANPAGDKTNMEPTAILRTGYLTTYRYVNENLENNGTYVITATLYDKDGKVIDSQPKGPDTVNGSSDPTNFDTKVTNNSYQFLTTLPGLSALCEIKNNNGDCIKYKEGGFDAYIKIIINLIYGLIALIAVFQIVYYGITYMLTATPFMKTTSKERVQNAVMGIVIALGSFLILSTINPALVSVNVNGPKINITNKNGSLFDSVIGFTAGSILPPGTLPDGVVCGSSVSTVKGIAESFIGHVSYEVGGYPIKGKGEPGLNGTINYDCSGYVDKVLSCANLPKTAGMDSGSAVNGHKGEAIKEADISADGKSVKGIALVPGDVLGWNTVGETYGHLVIYIGDGKIANSTGPSVTKDGQVNMNVVGKAVSILDTTYYKKQYNQIFRINKTTDTNTNTDTNNGGWH